ncbi:dynamin family protein [Leucobacter sp. GX24907]
MTDSIPHGSSSFGITPRDAMDSARNLLSTARIRYVDRPDVLVELDALNERLDQPLRIALVGSVKAGKSTLLNGLLGERIAPTDSRECTRIVTWYRYSATPRVQGCLADGETVTLPARRQHDRLELDLDGLTSEDFERLEVSWPAPGTRGITLIDTPGIASISQDASHQTNRFLLPEQGAAGADAVVYLLRSLHESDVRYLRSLHDRTRHGNASMGSIAVLSRADELGASRLSAMLTVNQVVEKLRNAPEVAGVCETIVPVAGLLGTGAMTLRQADFTVFRNLSEQSADASKTLLVSAERFIAARDAELPSEQVRADLVERFGMYGIRLAIAALRGGIDNAVDLAAELLRRSGLEELRRVIDVHFTQRQSELKAHSVVFALHQLLRQHPTPGTEQLLLLTDEHMAAAHTFTEMHLVGRIAGGRLDLPADLSAELERLVGGRGADIAVRLGVDPESIGADPLAVAAASHSVGTDPQAIDDDALLGMAVAHLARWRGLKDNPLLDSETLRACEIAERSCEMMILELMHRSSQEPAAPMESCDAPRSDATNA